jgi:hypothetical protein
MLNHLWAGAKRSAAREVHPTSRSQLTLDTTRREVYACRDRSPRYVGDARHAAGTRQRCVGATHLLGTGHTLWGPDPHRGDGVTPCGGDRSHPVRLWGQVTPCWGRLPLPGKGHPCRGHSSPPRGRAGHPAWESHPMGTGHAPDGDRSRSRENQTYSKAPPHRSGSRHESETGHAAHPQEASTQVSQHLLINVPARDTECASNHYFSPRRLCGSAIPTDTARDVRGG